jgi:hypothetical protein
MKLHLHFAANRICNLQQIAHEIAHKIARVTSTQPGPTLLDFDDQVGTGSVFPKWQDAMLVLPTRFLTAISLFTRAVGGRGHQSVSPPFIEGV